MVVAAVSATVPEWLAAAPLFVIAPVPPTPVPEIVSASAPTAWPFKSKAAPLATVAPPATVPRPSALPSRMVPALMATAPSKVFAPFSASVPVPVLVRPLPPALLPSAAATVSVVAGLVISMVEFVPVPCRVKAVSFVVLALAPVYFSVVTPPPWPMNTFPEPNAAMSATSTVPATMTLLVVCAFVAFDSTSVPAPSFQNSVLPVICPLSVAVVPLATSTKRLPPVCIAMGLAKVGASERFSSSLPVRLMVPAPAEPVVPPLPSWSTPAARFVAPL